MINLDNASTTAPIKEAILEMEDALTFDYFNMGAKYNAAKVVERKYNAYKEKLLTFLGAKEGSVIVCPSATIANNLCLFSINPKSKGKIIVSAGEHPSVYECAKSLQNLGANLVFCPLAKSGQIDLEKFQELCDENVIFVSIMHVNNETGAINDVKKITQIAKLANPNCLVHSDGVQAFGKINVNLNELGVDFYTISSHKIGGPKGVGALYVKNKNKLKPLIIGGGQEKNLISGTANYPSFASFMTAATIKFKSLNEDFQRVKEIKTQLINEFKTNKIDFKINGEGEVSPYILNVSFAGIRGEALLYLLADRGILVSNGSACSSNKRGNRILEAMGLNKNEVDGAVRISFDWREDYPVKEIANIFNEEINKIKH